MLEERERDHGHERVPTQSSPGAAFEVVEAEFLLQSLMRLLADPARLDRRREGLQVRVGRPIVADAARQEVGRGVGRRRGGVPEPAREHKAMSQACSGESDGQATRNAGALRAADGLALAASPTFAIMVLLTGVQAEMLNWSDPWLKLQHRNSAIP